MSGYETLDDAAAAALYNVHHLPDADKFEYLGLLYQDPDTGRYHFTEPQSTGKRGKASGKFTIPPGSLRATYHNHPHVPGKTSEERRKLFSRADLRTIDELGVPGFISAGVEVFRRDPGQEDDPKPVSNLRVGTNAFSRRMQVGQGTPVLAQIPLQEIIRRRAELAGLLGPAPELPPGLLGRL